MKETLALKAITMNQTELDFFLAKDVIEDFIPKIGKDLWQTVYWLDAGPHWRHGSPFFVGCALLTADAAKKAIQDGGYFTDLEFASHAPSVYKMGSDVVYEPTYNRPIKPFVLDEYDEGLCEEFRLFHACKINAKRNGLVVEDESGNLVEIAKIEKNRVQVHWKYLKSFLAISQLHLEICVDCVRYSSDARIYQLDEKEDKGDVNGFRWRWRNEPKQYRSENKTFSRLVGKTIISPTSRHDAYDRKYGPDTRRDEVKFIIGVDENGEERTFGCNPNYLANNFGANAENPNFLTPVHFRKQVLDKYYDESEKYTVQQGGVWRNDCLLLKADIDHRDKVVVYLGDLFELPYEEMMYWRSYNVLPEGGISRSAFKNDFDCDPTDAEVADICFKRTYTLFKKKWKEKHGFSPFKEPSEHDSSLLQTLQIPSTNSQHAFDDQVLILTKLLIDLIDVREIDRQFVAAEDKEGSIAKFGCLFENYPNAVEVTEFFRALQKLRSKGSAHSKGRSYEQAVEAMGISLDNKPEAFESILNTAVRHLENLLKHLQ